MTRILLSLAAFVLASPLFEARADFPRLGIFRKKKEDAPANEKDAAAKLKTLLETLKSDTDEKKRLAALEELGAFDPRAHADLIPTLTTALKSDPSPAVRASVAETIGGLKPTVQTAGVALEQVNANDPSEAVRKAAQSALWQYHLNGYRSAGANPVQPQTAEPPLAKGKPKAAPPVQAPTPVRPTVVATPVSTPKVGAGNVYPQTAEPPLAKPKVAPEAVQPPVPSLAVPALPVVPTVPTVPTVPSIPPPQP
jgi:hypothetical protein